MISVIVPVYNVEEYLSICIESILNQTFTDFELLLIDDGSTDNSGKICDLYAEKDSRCIVIHQTNKGVSEARNIGLDNAKGEYISFIDSDDYIHPQMFEILYNEIRKGNFDCSMILHKAVEGYCNSWSPLLDYSTMVFTQEQLMKALFNVKIPNNQMEENDFQVVWNKLYKSKIINKIRFINTSTEDTEFNNRVYLKCNKIVVIFTIAYYWFQRSSSLNRQCRSNRYVPYSYYICWKEMPYDKEDYKGYCLEKLYKSILNYRYYAVNSIYKHEADKRVSELVYATKEYFIKNQHIKYFMKLILIFFYKYPFFYKIFMSLTEIRSIYIFLVSKFKEKI